MCARPRRRCTPPRTRRTRHILSDSECQVVFAEDDTQIAKLTARKAELPAVHKVVTFDGAADGDWVISIEDLEKLGDAYLAEHPGVIEETAKGIRATSWPPSSTSGTTGRPKGVRLRHNSWVYEGEAIAAGHPQRGRPRVPLAADGALVRQGADVDPDGVRLLRRHRRPRRQDHRQPAS